MNRRLVAAATLALAFHGAAGGAEEGHDEHEHAEHGHEEAESDEHGAHAGTVRLTPEELRELGIAMSTSGPGLIERRLELPGEVVPNADRLAHIVPRFSGIATAVRVRVGDVVDVGDVLAVVESDESLAPFEVRTLISGTVIDKHITLGEAASRDRDAFVIADLSSVWVELTVYQQDLADVRPEQSVNLLVGHEPAGTGTIDYVTPIVDAHTRTATARMALANEDGRWRPGMFVTARVLVERLEVPVAVPRTALHTMDGQPVIFVLTERGFAPHVVSIGRRGDDLVEIQSGLDAGVSYASDGGFTIKAELGKDAFGHGHVH